MPRIKLDPQERYQHTYETTIEVTDLNYGNHMGNDALVGIIHRARVHLLPAKLILEMEKPGFC
ncbi:hypothetical protein ACFL3R_01495 [Thermodesulfobacteriota bacterium]